MDEVTVLGEGEVVGIVCGRGGEGGVPGERTDAVLGAVVVVAV